PMRTTVMALLLFAPLLPLLASAAGAEPARPEEQKNTIRHTFVGKAPDGTPVELFTLRKGEGITVKIMNYGGIVTELHAPDKAGKTADVVLGFDDLKGYVDGHPFFGALVGRCANRIAKGKFTLEGKEYKLATNNGPNHLHGGNKGFD